MSTSSRKCASANSDRESTRAVRVRTVVLSRPVGVVTRTEEYRSLFISETSNDWNWR